MSYIPTSRRSTLNYLDEDGNVSFFLVPWKRLNEWLSKLNGVKNLDVKLPAGLNRGKVIEELETRRKNKSNLHIMTRIVGVDRGFGKDWREYKNDDGLDHFEELLICQPAEWRIQAREYLFSYKFDITSKRCNSNARPTHEIDLLQIMKPSTSVSVDPKKEESASMKIVMDTPITIGLFHPDIPKTKRYEPIRFLLSYDAKDPLPDMVKKALSHEGTRSKIDLIGKTSFSAIDESELESFFNRLMRVGREVNFPRLPLLKELNFCKITGQRLSKYMIAKEVILWLQGHKNYDDMLSPSVQPLSLVFAGPSGNGKTELAEELALLLNKPNDDCYHKVDCGKLTEGNEFFGMSGAYYGSNEGSSLNNFIVRMSQSKKIGVVLLDEIDKARSNVYSGLYQVLDKGEWTNKKLEGGAAGQTSIVPCNNMIFIMTTNRADSCIETYAKTNPDVYTTPIENMEDLSDDLQDVLSGELSTKFANAFLGRISCFIPFFPLSVGSANEDVTILREVDTIAKYLIEQKMEELHNISGIEVEQNDKTMERIAKIVCKKFKSECGVRSIQKLVDDLVSRKAMHADLLEPEYGGISSNCTISFQAKVDESKVSIRQLYQNEDNETDDLYDSASFHEAEDLYA